MSDLRALALIYDIRGFTAASKRLRTADLGAFATAAHRVILDLFAAHPPTFVKNLGDGHLLLWECAQGLDGALVRGVVEGAQRARTTFATFATRQREAGSDLPGRVGIGVAFGEVHRSDDYYGTALNLASRLQGVARPEGLALDEGVFEAVRQGDADLRARFRRARVRLKGLGSTVVWVDRPFSWARALRPVALGLALLAVPVAYVLLCDAGLALPGGAALRRALDARDLSLLRPVHAADEVARVAQGQRLRLVNALLANRTPQGWFFGDFVPPGADPEQAQERERGSRVPDIWSLSQAAYALLTAPPPGPAGLDEALRRCLLIPFEPGQLVEAQGLLWGWRPGAGAAYTEAEPTLWTVAALAAALRRPGFLAGETRAEGERRLALATQAAAIFCPQGAGWNIYPKQVNVRRHSPYSTTLALLALLEVRAAGQPWQGETATRDRLLADTAQFLVRSFVADARPAGWRRTAEPGDKISTGLTMQALSTLLRAEAEAGIALPEALVESIPAALVERAEAQAADDYDMGEFKVEFTSHEGTTASQSEGINFLSHPWAIQLAGRYLARAERVPTPRADVVAVRRALGRLVVEQGAAAVDKALTGYTFVASETLIGLSGLTAEPAR